MFDGLARFPVPRPTPPRPAPIDTVALLPVLRTMAAEAMVEHLAVDAAVNAVCAQQWLANNWGAGADLRDHNHPWRAAALSPDSPPARYGEAVAALANACWRYRMTTGRDGVALAREVVSNRLGRALADHVITTLRQSATVWDGVDELLFECGPAGLPAAPEPTPEQRQEAGHAALQHALSYPDMDGLHERLDALSAAWWASQGDGDTPDVRTALGDLKSTIDGIMVAAGDDERVAAAEGIQATLDIWRSASGVPVQINLLDYE